MSLTDAVDELIEDTGSHKALPSVRVRADDELSSREMGEVLRAAALARHWIKMTASEKPERLTPFRCFVLGALAAWKDRV